MGLKEISQEQIDFENGALEVYSRAQVTNLRDREDISPLEGYLLNQLWNRELAEKNLKAKKAKGPFFISKIEKQVCVMEYGDKTYQRTRTQKYSNRNTFEEDVIWVCPDERGEPSIIAATNFNIEKLNDLEYRYRQLMTI